MGFSNGHRNLGRTGLNALHHPAIATSWHNVISNTLAVHYLFFPFLDFNSAKYAVYASAFVGIRVLPLSR
jgi:hypothetical protein